LFLEVRNIPNQKLLVEIEGQIHSMLENDKRHRNYLHASIFFKPLMILKVF